MNVCVVRRESSGGFKFSNRVVLPACIGICDTQIEMSQFKARVDPDGLLKKRQGNLWMAHLDVGIREVGKRLGVVGIAV